MVLMMLF